MQEKQLDVAEIFAGVWNILTMYIFFVWFSVIIFYASQVLNSTILVVISNLAYTALQ
jgi:hypothetical protein